MMEQEKKELKESLKDAHKRHILAPLEFDYSELPKYSTRDPIRRFVYFHEFLHMEMGEIRYLKNNPHRQALPLK